MTDAFARAIVSNTGPLISAFQSSRVDILRQFYDVIFIPDSELIEFEQHGVAEAIRELLKRLLRPSPSCLTPKTKRPLTITLKPKQWY